MENLETSRAGYSARFKVMISRNNNQKFNNKLKESLVTLGIIFFALSVWELLSALGKISPSIFPAPSMIFATLFRDLSRGIYTKNIIITMSRMIIGILFGGTAGLIMGLIMGWASVFRRIMDPIIAFLHPIPKLALLPMVLIIFGLGETSRIVMISISAFFPMLINTMFGVRQINPIYYDVLENYGATKFDIFKKVVLAGSMPYILSGYRLSFKSALTTGIGIEMVFGTSGLGSSLWLAWETMRMWNLYSIIIIIAVIGAGTTWILELIKTFFLPWHHENRPAS